MLSIVPIKQYCKLSGETLASVTRRIERGLWIEGKQVVKINGVRERWIDLTEVETWARNNGNYHAG